jgi:hypothetical protein
MKECCVCFNGYKNGVRCFGSCNMELCLQCFNSILKVNVVDDIEYSCPQCRYTCIKNLDRNFTKFLYNNKKCLKRIVILLEQRLEQKSKQSVDNTWEQFTLDLDEHIHEHLINLSTEQLAEITGVDYNIT